MVNKFNFSNLIQKFDLDKKIVTLAPKAELKTEINKVGKLQASHSKYFCSKSYFEDYGTQNYLLFQLILG